MKNVLFLDQDVVTSYILGSGESGIDVTLCVIKRFSHKEEIKWETWENLIIVSVNPFEE